ncbi:hypothetical protein PN460_02555, partial [Nodularia sphaerocarpa CS-585A2]|nr:hypothetical protein [Nodularia sphaerocarpa CS-585A2]
MANRSRKPTPKSSQENGKKPVSSKPRKQSQWGWLWSTVALALLLSSAGLIVAFSWMSILFIFNPAQLAWVNEFLPAGVQIPVNKGERPQSLPEIQDNLSSPEQIAGKSLALDAEEDSFLLPIFQQRVNCQSDCQEIVELRVYQRSQDREFQSQSEKYYDLAAQFPIT